MMRTLILMGTAATAPAPSDDAGRSVARDADGLFRVPGVRGGVRGGARVAFVVDTGATATVLSRADAARLGVVMGAEARLTTAGGETRMRWGRLTGLTVAGRALPPLDVAVPEIAPPHALLGQDAIAALGRITIDRDRLAIGAVPRD